MVSTDELYTHRFTGGYHTLDVCGSPFQISDNVSDIRNLFMSLGLAVRQENLTDDYL